MHSGHCGILGFFCRWILSDESLKIVLCKWMTPFLLRLSEKCTYASVTMKKNHCMYMTDILWYDLHLNTPVTDHMASIVLSNCVLPLPLLNMDARHAWILPLTPRSIMILHQREREPMTSPHWACKHDLCPVLFHLHNCLVTQVLSATRYVKTSSKFKIHPRRGSYGRLQEEKRLCLKTS